jgi:hypothetical protein
MRNQRPSPTARQVIALSVVLACLTGLSRVGADESAGTHFTHTLYLVPHGAYDTTARADPEIGPGLTPLGIAQARSPHFCAPPRAAYTPGLNYLECSRDSVKPPSGCMRSATAPAPSHFAPRSTPKKTGRRAEIVLANNRLQHLHNYVTLCQALGGGADVL